MARWKNVVFNISFALNCLLAFLLLFNDQLVIPLWLQVGGRMHPVLLHFPIVIIVLYGLWLLFARSNSHYSEIAQNLLLLSSITSVVTALCGLLLSREPGYDPDSLQLHKWIGSFTAFLLLAWYWLSSEKNLSPWFNIAASFTIFLIVTIAGDLGADITHGENFLMAPVTPDKKPIVPFEDALVYDHLVQPIFDEKCVSCHNSKKAKGELVMETKDLLLKGGKDGQLWDTTIADLGLLMRRIHLPEEEKEHMPPSGKPQLTDQELAVLHAWIKSGADMKKKVVDLAPGDTLRVLAQKRLKTSTEEKYEFVAADESAINKLNNTNRVIYPIALNSPALVVNFYNSPYFNSEQLAELKEIKEQIVELNLSKMPVKDEDLKIIADFHNVRTLNLNYSSITGASLAELRKLPFLKNLSLTGTAVKANQLAGLQNFPKLKSVYAWNTGLTTASVSGISKQSKIHFETGYNGDAIVMKLTPPVVLNEEKIYTGPEPIQLKHYIKGTTIRYTTDGSDPDTTTSPVYSNNLKMQNVLRLKMRAVKAGWYSSDVVSQYFFTTSYRPDSMQLLKPADAKYSSKGGKILIDLVKSDLGRGSGKWLGFRENDFEGVLSFHEPVQITSVTLSTLQDPRGYIFPPRAVEVWGGTDKAKLKLLGRIMPKQPVKGDPTENNPLTCEFAPTNVRYIKIIAKPLAQLPTWLKEEIAKGKIERAKNERAELEKARKEKNKAEVIRLEKAKADRSKAENARDDKPWIFIDEVLVN